MTQVNIRKISPFDIRAAEQTQRALAGAGLQGIEKVSTSQVYFLDGEIDESAVQDIADRLLHDPVVETWSMGKESAPVADAFRILVMKQPGVMDPAEASIKKGAQDLGYALASVRTGTQVDITGSGLDADTLRDAFVRSLANETVDEVLINQDVHDLSSRPPAYHFKKVEIPLRDLDDEALETLSIDNQLALNLREMKTIQTYFRERGREPTDVELESFAQTWSEHCVHKTLKSAISINNREYQNLFKETLVRATEEAGKDWCVSVFKDNAGIIRFNEDYDVTFKVETHNHPSALDPYGGAGTGLGGVLRDTLGTGLGAKPVANTDVFCFADLDTPWDKLPQGVLHPRRIFHGVVSGVRDYGNRMGIPTVNGAICFDADFIGNPLVFCGSIGLIPRGMSEKQAQVGDHIIIIGGETGRDGIHGATFSSLALDVSSEKTASTAVQIGNAITEKMLHDVQITARDKGYYHAVTDCGAGGFSSAVGEMGEKIGVEVHLEKAPLKYTGLSYTEIWISEAQERMVFAVSEAHVENFRLLCESEDVGFADIGVFTGTGRLVLNYEGHEVADLDMAFLHHGLPEYKREAAWQPAATSVTLLPEDLTPQKALLGLLADPNVASKEWVIRQYDHEVQSSSILKPLTGETNDGPGDAAVVAPVLGNKRAVAIGCGINVPLGKLDPFKMAVSVIDEAVRQVVAVGADPNRIALLDNFCWGDTQSPHGLGGLVRACEGCYETARGFDLPFISGKDSLNNVFDTPQRSISIPPTLLISAIGIVDDYRECVSMDLKTPGNALYLLGASMPGLGGSRLVDMHKLKGTLQPTHNIQAARKIYLRIHHSICQGLVRACHDLSEGGLAVAAAEMAFAGGVGLAIELDNMPVNGTISDMEKLFAETCGRLLLEVVPSHAEAFESIMKGVPFARIGITMKEKAFCATSNGRELMHLDLDHLKETWQAPLREP